MAEVINGILIREVETKNIMTKSSLPVGGYSVNPYVLSNAATLLDEEDYRQLLASIRPEILQTLKLSLSSRIDLSSIRQES